MGPVPEATQQKREQVYQAAVDEFQERGFSEASMDRISARAAVSKRTVYKYFESKEKLFQELLRRHWARFVESLDVTYDSSLDIRDQLFALGRSQGQLLSDPEVMAMTRLVMSEVLRSPQLVDEDQEKTDFTRAVEIMMHDADADGALRIEDPRAAAQEFMALIKGKAFWPVIFGAPVVSTDDMEKIVSNSVAMIVSRYGP